MAELSEQARECEKQVIATLLKDPSSRSELVGLMPNPAHFFKVDECQKLYSVMRNIHNKGGVIDIELMSSACTVPYETIRDIYDKYEAINPANRKIHVEMLVKNSLTFELSTSIYSDISSTLLDGSKTYSQKIEYIKEKSEELGRRQNTNADVLQPISKIVEEYKLILEDRKKGISFFPTGDRRIDGLMTYGFAPQELTTIAGRPSNGKSLMAQDISRKSANIGIPSAVFNLEMRNPNVLDRLVCMGAQLDPNTLVKCFDQMTKTDQDKMYAELDRMSTSMNLMMYDKPNLAIDGLNTIISQAQEANKKGYMVVYLDLATKLLEFSKAESQLEFQRECDKLQNLAKKLGIHLVMLLQVNRSSDKEKLTSLNDVYKLYPTFGQIKNSGAFEEVSDNIFLVCKPSNYLNKYEWGEFVPPHIRLEIGKQRGGAPSGMSEALLYKLNNSYLGLITPEKDWDPLKISLDQNDISAFVNKGR